MSRLTTWRVAIVQAVGLTNGHECELPITQTEIGDALGLSTVHVNRCIQALRGKGLITLRGSVLNVANWERLKEAGEFDPTYLHLEQTTRGQHEADLQSRACS